MRLEALHNRIDLVNVPFTDRGSRLLVFRKEDQFSIRLAERWVKWEAEEGHYRQRTPIVTGFTFLSDVGTPLTELHIDTYPHCVQIQNEVGQFKWVFVDPETLLLSLPSGCYRLEFIVRAERGQTDFRGGTFHGKRNLAYTTNAHLLQNTIESTSKHKLQVKLKVQAEEGDALLLNITPRMAFNRSIPNPSEVLAQAYAVWEAWFEATPPVLEEYRSHYDYAWWIMRSGLVNTRYYFTREALLPSKVHYVGVWHWDQVFHALAYRHVEPRLAEDQLRIILDHQLEDGMLPDAIHDEGLVTYLKLPVEAAVTKPPIMTWAVLKMFETSHHQDFLEEIYESLVRWNRWWMNTNRDKNGLCQYYHPFSSGLDDSPLWDKGVPVVSPDLNTYLVLQCDSLAQIARLIGQEEAALNFERESAIFIEQMIAHLWDETAGVFRALYKGKPLDVLTPFSLLPLLTAKLPPEITLRLIDNLINPNLFWTPYPLSTVAISDPAFDPQQMWRGPVWININYLFVEALKRNGEHQLAAHLRQKTLELVMSHSDIYEYYNPMTGDHPPKAAPTFGWSAALFIELALDETQWRESGAKTETSMSVGQNTKSAG